MNCLKLSATIILLFARSAWPADPPDKVEIPAEVISVANGTNQFATELYTRLSSDNRTNFFFSPYSISTALAMAYAGAKGQTKKEMAIVFHFPKDESELHLAMNSMQKTFVSNSEKSGFELRVANRLWGQEGFYFLPEFLQVTKGDYGAELGLVDFKQTEVARKSINSWVEKQTNRKIQNLIAPGILNANSRLVLTNAIYFKARWKEEFQKNRTSDAPFYVSETEQVTVPTMHQTHIFRYAETDEAQFLELPYRWDGSLSMLICLPKANDGLSGLEKELSSENLSKCCKRLEPQNVEVYLPKFKMTSEFNLSDVLKSMGLPLAFSNNADFSRISVQDQLSLSAVIHKAFVDVNEEGTEATAATGGGFFGRSVRSPKVPIEFRADHPFVFLIRYNRTQSILFLGRVMNPIE